VTIIAAAGTQFVAEAINDAGLVAGVDLPTDPNSPTTAVIYDSLARTFTEVSPSAVSAVHQITDSGFVLGVTDNVGGLGWYWSPIDRQEHLLHTTAAGMSENSLILLTSAQARGRFRRCVVVDGDRHVHPPRCSDG